MGQPVAACTCGEQFHDHAEAGNHDAQQCDGTLVFAAEEIEEVADSKAVTMSDSDSEFNVVDYAQIGSYEYTANVQNGTDDLRTVYVNLFEGEVRPVGPNTKDISSDHKRELITNMVENVPQTFDQPITLIRNDHQVTGVGGGGGGGNGSSSGDDDSGGFDGDVISDPGEHDYDAEEAEENVDQWLSNYANVKGSMLEDAWSLEFAEITDPDSGESELGVHIDVAPWYAGPDIWDSSDREWADDDASETFGDHREAMRNIFTDDDSPVEGVAEDNGGDYADWYNYVPADEAADL